MTGGTRNWGNYFGLLLVLGQLYVLFTGSMTGTDRLRVRRVTISVPNLPKSFDGYRIVQFSDIHLGSMRSELLERAVEQMNRQALAFAARELKRLQVWFGKTAEQEILKYDGNYLAEQLENSVWYDLQMIRVNGSLVGAILGAVIYLVMYAVKGGAIL